MGGTTFWFEFGGTDTGLTVARLPALAQALGVFGSPSFAVGDEPFRGDDRLEDALASATVAHPGTSAASSPGAAARAAG
jgi:2-hydroxychromene-2-carboxylate isomerase